MSDAPGFPGAFHVEQMFDLWYNLFRHLYAWGCQMEKIGCAMRGMRCARCGNEIKPGELFFTRRINYTDGESRLYYSHLQCRRLLRLPDGRIVQLAGVVS